MGDQVIEVVSFAVSVTARMLPESVDGAKDTDRLYQEHETPKDS